MKHSSDSTFANLWGKLGPFRTKGELELGRCPIRYSLYIFLIDVEKSSNLNMPAFE